MSNAANQNINNKAALAGWTIESQRSHYSARYWAMFILGMLGQMVPTPPRITYVVRNNSSGVRREVTLPGDHNGEDLVISIARER